MKFRDGSSLINSVYELSETSQGRQFGLQSESLCLFDEMKGKTGVKSEKNSQSKLQSRYFTDKKVVRNSLVGKKSTELIQNKKKALSEVPLYTNHTI